MGKRAALFGLAFLCIATYRVEGEDCSAEKVNNDCTLTINRRFPVAMPTLQMRPHSKVTVVVTNPLPFETLGLDFQGAQAVAGTDQAAGLLTAATPYFKSLLFMSSYRFAAVQMAPGSTADPIVPVVEQELEDLSSRLSKANTGLNIFGQNARRVYIELQEILASIPRTTCNPPVPISDVLLIDDGVPICRLPTKAPAPFPRSKTLDTTPDPWDDYHSWRNWILHELVGEPCSQKPCPSFANLLGEGLKLQTRLTAIPPTPFAPAQAYYPIFDREASCDFDEAAAALKRHIEALSSEDARKKYSEKLDTLVQQKQEMLNLLPAISLAVTSIVKDLQTYVFNIVAASDKPAIDLKLGDVNDVPEGD